MQLEERERDPDAWIALEQPVGFGMLERQARRSIEPRKQSLARRNFNRRCAHHDALAALAVVRTWRCWGIIGLLRLNAPVVATTAVARGFKLCPIRHGRRQCLGSVRMMTAAAPEHMHQQRERSQNSDELCHASLARAGSSQCRDWTGIFPALYRQGLKTAAAFPTITDKLPWSSFYTATGEEARRLWACK